MDRDTSVRILAELYFIKKAEMTTPHSSIPPCLLTKDFSQRMQILMSLKQIALHYRWRNYFDTFYCKMLASHETYLVYMMTACTTEYTSNENVFESFICLLAVIKDLSEETLEKTGMDFRSLNVDIFMVFYRNSMEKCFLKCGGFRRLVEYIRKHKYLKWNKNSNISGTSTGALNPDTAGKQSPLNESRKKMFESLIGDDEVGKHSLCLAKEVLSLTTVELPALLTKTELVQKMVAFRRKELMKTAEETKSTEAAFGSEPLKIFYTKFSNLDIVKSNEDIETNEVNEKFEPFEKISKGHLKSDYVVDHPLKPAKGNGVPLKGAPKIYLNSDCEVNHPIKPTRANGGPLKGAPKIYLNSDCEVNHPLKQAKANGEPSKGASKRYSKSDYEVNHRSKAIGTVQPLKEIPKRHLKSVSDINRPSKQTTDIARYEDIIQAVVRYNSKSSGTMNSNNRIHDQMETVHFLKGKIVYLIDILDKK